MARILCISSEVSRGFVGATAARVALQRLGHDAWVLPTIVLTNHTGYKHIAGTRLAPDLLAKMMDAIEANGWLPAIDAVFTGYLPSAEHVAFAAEAIARVRRARADVQVLCDPILGDDPAGLYIEEGAAVAVRERLLPVADVITPNRFELAWMSGLEIEAGRDPAAQAIAAAARLPVRSVIATSVPVGADGGRLANVLIERGRHWIVDVPKLESPPHGTGDLLASVYLGEVMGGLAAPEAMARAAAIVKHVIEQSYGSDELRLVPALEPWSEVPALPVRASPKA